MQSDNIAIKHAISHKIPKLLKFEFNDQIFTVTVRRYLPRNASVFKLSLFSKDILYKYIYINNKLICSYKQNDPGSRTQVYLRQLRHS